MPSKIAETWIERFNAKDLEGLLSLYTEDAVHLSPKLKARKPETKGLIRGKAALRSWWKDAFEGLPNLHYKIIAITSAKDRIVLEYMRTASGEPDMAVAEVFEIDSQNKIKSSRVYHG